MKKFIFNLFCIILFHHANFYAQNLQWITKISGINNQHFTGNRIAANSAGYSHVVSTFSGQTILSSTTLTANGQQAVCFAKYDPSGILNWAGKINSSNYCNGNAISVDKQNSVYVTGAFVNNATFHGTVTLNSTGNGSDLFVAKYDSTGNLKWVKNFSGTNGGTTPLSICNDSLLNTYVTGNISGSVNFGTLSISTGTSATDMFVVKLDNLGNVVWVKNFGGNTQINAYDLTLDHNLNIYIYGHFGNVGSGGLQKMFVGTDTLKANANTPDIFLVKLDNNGNPLFAKKFGGNFSGDRGLGIAFDNRSHLYVTGGFEGSAAFGSHTIFTTPSVASAYDCYIAKLDLNGNCQWAQSGDTTIAFSCLSINIPSRNSIYIGGDALFEFDSTGIRKNVVKIRSDGISTDSYSNVYLTASFAGTLSTNLGTLTTGGPTTVNNFVAKIGSALFLSNGPTNSITNTLKIFPNPTSENIKLDGLPFLMSDVFFVEIMDISGQTVIRTQNFGTINVSHLSDGLYSILIIKSNGEEYIARFVKISMP